jgi:hypothetical protein
MIEPKQIVQPPTEPQLDGEVADEGGCIFLGEVYEDTRNTNSFGFTDMTFRSFIRYV